MCVHRGVSVRALWVSELYCVISKKKNHKNYTAAETNLAVGWEGLKHPFQRWSHGAPLQPLQEFLPWLPQEERLEFEDELLDSPKLSS